MDRLLLIIAALLFSTGGAAIKACSLPAWEVAGLRSGVAAVTLVLWFPRALRFDWQIALTGSAYAATLVLYVIANKLTTSANAIFLQSTSPFYLLLLGPWVLHEPIRRIHLLLIAGVGCGGILLLLGSEAVLSTAPDPARGNIVAACSGVTWALAVTGFRWLARARDQSDHAMSAVIFGNLLALATCLPFAAPFAAIHLRDGIILLYLGVFQVGFAYVALTRAVRRVTALEAAVLLLIEPVFNPIWSWLFHGERPSNLALSGGV